ncbi:MAG: hypothetical protein GYB67_08755 [Chloroflexi bacterium]|nr:hypothetical protein [Chloroflexota bacterium]
MISNAFAEKLSKTQAARQTDRALLMRPRLAQMPLPMQRYDDPFLPFSKAIIAATRDNICAYVFDFAAYLALGAAGAVALERSIAYAGADGETITVLHGPFAHTGYAEAVGKHAFNADAVTVTDAALSEGFLREVGGVFVLSDRAGAAPDHLDSISVFDQSNARLTLAMPERTIVIRILGDPVLYAGQGDDFAEQARRALEATQ